MHCIVRRYGFSVGVVQAQRRRGTEAHLFWGSGELVGPTAYYWYHGHMMKGRASGPRRMGNLESGDLGWSQDINQPQPPAEHSCLKLREYIDGMMKSIYLQRGFHSGRV